MILLYENDYDQIEFLKKITSRLPELIPKIVVRTKTDIKNNEPLESTQSLLKYLGNLKIGKEVSCKMGDNLDDLVHTIVDVC
jgi:hypothetical protein